MPLILRPRADEVKRDVGTQVAPVLRGVFHPEKPVAGGENVRKRDEEPPFESGSQAAPERPPEVPGAGRSTAQLAVLVIGAVVVVAAVLWLLVPILGSR